MRLSLINGTGDYEGVGTICRVKKIIFLFLLACAPASNPTLLMESSSSSSSFQAATFAAG
jgi:hypothetical protein